MLQLMRIISKMKKTFEYKISDDNKWSNVKNQNRLQQAYLMLIKTSNRINHECEKESQMQNSVIINIFKNQKNRSHQEKRNWWKQHDTSLNYNSNQLNIQAWKIKQINHFSNLWGFGMTSKIMSEAKSRPWKLNSSNFVEPTCSPWKYNFSDVKARIWKNC